MGLLRPALPALSSTVSTNFLCPRADCQPEPPRLMDRVLAYDLRDDLPAEAILEPEVRIAKKCKTFDWQLMVASSLPLNSRFS